MKIAHINCVYGIKSTGRMTEELVKELDRLGHENLVVCIEHTANYKNSYRLVSNYQRNIHAVLSRISGKQAYWSYYPTKKLIKKLEEFNPDIIHFGVIHSNGIHLKTLLEYIEKKNISTIITLHDCWFFTGKCTYPIKTNCHEWQNGCGKCTQLKNDNISWFLNKTKTMYKDKKEWLNKIKNLSVIGVSNWVANEAKKSFLKDKNIITIYNWIDQGEFYPRKNSKLRDKYNLHGKYIILGVSVGWKYGHKGYDDFLKLSKLIDKDTVIVLVGAFRDDLQIPPNIILTGRTDSTDELAEIYSVSDVYITLSPHETFGLTTAEALCCGTPVIVYNNTASPELVGEGCGYVVGNGDLIMVLNKIEQIMKNGKSFYYERCISFANANFSKDINIKKYIDLYLNIIKK